MKAALLALPLLLMAGGDVHDPYALATLKVQQGGTRGDDGVYRGGVFRAVFDFTPPTDHGPRNGLIAFEGPGWESDLVAYRLYLDERNVPDIFGKKLPDPVLPKIGQGKDDYHVMADWGQDILQVNQSLGAGGIGVWRDGKVTQLGPAQVSASITHLPQQAAVSVNSRDFAGEDGPASLAATYSIRAGSRITDVDAIVTGAVPRMIAGIIRHPRVRVVRGSAGKWSYIGTWGVQSLAKDELGMVLFYRTDSTTEPMVGKTDISIQFCDRNRFRYAFAAAWVQEPAAPKTLAAFRDWATSAAAHYDRGDVAPAVTPCPRPDRSS